MQSAVDATFRFLVVVAFIGMFRAEPPELRLLIAALVGALGLGLIALNYAALWQRIFRKEHRPINPIIGAVLVAGAIRAFAFPRHTRFEWVPLLFDPVGVVLIAALIKWRRATP